MRFTFRARLVVLFVAAVLLVTAVSTAVAVERGTAAIESRLEAEQENDALSAARAMQDHLDSAHRSLLSSASLIQSDHVRPEPNERTLGDVLDPLVASNRELSAVLVIDAAGAVVFSRGPTGDGSFATAPRVAGSGVEGAASLGNGGGPPYWVVPIVSTRDTTQPYYLIGLLSEAALENVLFANQHGGTYAAFLDDDDAVIASTDASIGLTSLADWPALDQLRRGRSVKTASPGGDGEVLATESPLVSLPGSVVMISSTASIAALQANLVRSALLTAAFLALVTIVLGVFVAGRISRPLLTLERATQRLARGDLSARAEEVGARELRSLAHDFNAMASSLSEQQRLLQDSEERHRSLVENAPVGIYRTTPDGRVLAANPALARMLGYDSAEEYMGRNLETSPYDPSYSRRDWKARLEKAGEIRGLESAWRRKDGSVIVVRESTKVVRDAAGKVQSYEGTVEDVTERRRAERAMRAAQERLESFVANSPDPILIADLDLTVRKVNSAFERVFGWRTEELVGRPLPTIPLDRLGEVKERIARIARGESVPAAESVREHKDGHPIPVSTALSPVKDARGRVVGVAAVIRDISERRKAEEALKASERRFRALSQHAFEGIAIHSEGRLLEANRAFARMFGFRPRELRSMSLLGLVAPKSLREAETRLANPRDEPYEIVCRRKDGSTFPVEVMARSIPYKGGTARVTAVRDLSERRKLERAVEKRRKLEEENRRSDVANRLKSEFLANMSHELRTPLNAILGFAQLMRDRAAGPVTNEQEEFLGDIVTSAGHLHGLINDVLDLAKIEAGRVTFRPESVWAAKMVEEAVGSLRPLADAKRLRVDVDVAPEVGEVVLDPSRFKQVLYNYLSNAIKFSAERGHVWVRVLPEREETFRFEVEDDGIGMRPHDLPKLFQEFQQLDQGAGKKYAGTGLGLALTKKLVEAQGGSVGVVSVHGKGSTFHAVLPRDTRPYVSGSDRAGDRDTPAAPGHPRGVARSGPTGEKKAETVRRKTH